MNGIVIKLQGDGAWPDLKGKVGTDQVIHLAALSAGMTSGRPSIMLRFDLPDGRTVLAETSLRLLLTAAEAFRARYGSGGE